jgi:hypothetical protein
VEEEMTGTEEWESTHRQLSPLDLKFRGIAMRSPIFLDRQHFRTLDEAKLRFPLQSWPTFIGAEKLKELKWTSVEVSRLLRSVPERVLGTDPVKLSNFYGLGSPSVAEVLFTPPTGAETMISRGDLIETASGFKCIEFNFTPSLGGLDATVVTGLQLAAPPTARFIRSEGIDVTFTDTIFEMFRHIIEDVRTKGSFRNDEITIALVTDPYEVPRMITLLGYMNDEVQRTIASLGLTLKGLVVACSPAELTLKGNGLRLDNRKVDAVVELTSNSTPPSIYRLFKGEVIGLYNGPLGIILSNKRTLALLSEHAASFLPAEQAFIEEHVPWTRLVVEGPVDYAGQTHPLIELLRGHRDLFVLKDSNSCGGEGVVIGKFASQELWRETVDRALLEGDWVVQEVQQSLPYLYQSGDYGCSVHDMIWGPFVFGDRYGGVILRMQPKAVGGAVNLSIAATEGIVLEV